MDGLAHIFLHVGLCTAMANASPDTTLAIHVQMAYHAGGAPVDQTFHVPRGDGDEVVLEFDAPRGPYRVSIDAPKYGCASSGFASVIGDQNRKIVATLTPGTPPAVIPELMLQGLAPTSFLYVKPTYVMFDAGAACNQPVPAALPEHVDFDYDQGAYYLTLYADPAVWARSPVFAMRLRTTTGLFHYVRVRLQLPPVAVAWPADVRFDVSEDMVDALATEKTDVLLCPKLWATSAG